MRRAALIIAGVAAASCGGPGSENSSAADANDANVQQEIASRNAAGLNQQAEPLTAPEGNRAAEVIGQQPSHPCLMQGVERLQVAPIRAVGTEPFWSAHVQGRCVTYSTPENQQGVRVWTRYSDSGNGRGTWIGQLDGKSFEMRVSPQAGCSDGMSDKRYPMAVELLVGGEKRRGCAEPL